MEFPTNCSECGAEGICKMCVVTIPYFSEIIIMAHSCLKCNYRSSEIKQGGGVKPAATKIVFTAKEESDLNRDVFKSDTCTVNFPELGLELQPGTQGSMYTTIEGLFDQIHRHLEQTNPFGQGDSKTSNTFKEFMTKMKEMQEGKHFPFVIELDDPLSNCFIYNPLAPEDDPQIVVTVYKRTTEQEDELGISDMNV